MRASGSHSVTFEGVELPRRRCAAASRPATPRLHGAEPRRRAVSRRPPRSASPRPPRRGHLSRRAAGGDDARARTLVGENAIELSASRGALSRAAALLDVHAAEMPTSGALFAETQAAKTFVEEAGVARRRSRARSDRRRRLPERPSARPRVPRRPGRRIHAPARREPRLRARRPTSRSARTRRSLTVPPPKGTHEQPPYGLAAAVSAAGLLAVPWFRGARGDCLGPLRGGAGGRRRRSASGRGGTLADAGRRAAAELRGFRGACWTPDRATVSAFLLVAGLARTRAAAA